MSLAPSLSADRIERWEVLNLLTSLVEKSLVVFEEDDQGVGRYRLLETVRQYSRDRLLESREMEALRHRHLAFFLQLAEAAQLLEFNAYDVERLQYVEAEHENLRAALEWSLQTDGDSAGRLAVALAVFWDVRGYWSEGEEALERALSLAGGNQGGTEADLLMWLSRLNTHRGEKERAGELAEASIRLFRASGDMRGLARSLNRRGAVEAGTDPESARRYLEEALAVSRAIGYKQHIAMCLNNLGLLALLQGDWVAARRLVEESMCLNRELGTRYGLAHNRLVLGYLALAQADYEAARAALDESLAIASELGDRLNMAYALCGLGYLAGETGEPTARRLHMRSLRIMEAIGARNGVPVVLQGLAVALAGSDRAEEAAQLFGAASSLHSSLTAAAVLRQTLGQRAIERAHTALGEAAFTAAWAEGREMSLEQAVRYVLAVPEE